MVLLYVFSLKSKTHWTWPKKAWIFCKNSFPYVEWIWLLDLSTCHTNSPNPIWQCNSGKNGFLELIEIFHGIFEMSIIFCAWLYRWKKGQRIFLPPWKSSIEEKSRCRSNFLRKGAEKVAESGHPPISGSKNKSEIMVSTLLRTGKEQPAVLTRKIEYGKSADLS